MPRGSRRSGTSSTFFDGSAERVVSALLGGEQPRDARGTRSDGFGARRRRRGSGGWQITGYLVGLGAQVSVVIGRRARRPALLRRRSAALRHWVLAVLWVRRVPPAFQVVAPPRGQSLSCQGSSRVVPTPAADALAGSHGTRRVASHRADRGRRRPGAQTRPARAGLGRRVARALAWAVGTCFGARRCSPSDLCGSLAFPDGPTRSRTRPGRGSPPRPPASSASAGGLLAPLRSPGRSSPRGGGCVRASCIPRLGPRVARRGRPTRARSRMAHIARGDWRVQLARRGGARRELVQPTRLALGRAGSAPRASTPATTSCWRGRRRVRVC